MYNGKRTPHDDALDELCPQLSLEYRDQDWAICESDALRIAEFVNFYESHTDLSPLAKCMLFELVLASVSDALDAGNALGDEEHVYASFIRREAVNHRETIDHWIRRDQQRWAISRWLGRTLGPVKRDGGP